ncbi:hypothetical protein EUGRSUZ_B01048 [Eucalyptus grandis]|uniref:Uncharacterized protein n=2 Tax=Eucalyptus grandis TaxID=71139 RepID=A0ACC3LNZ3_EUCGR|nr:hypothetical protein EUGRSUZ_B01048 [Eucalyptus grandis]
MSADLDNTNYLVSRNHMDDSINSFIESFQALIAIVASLEIIRCGIWNFFRQKGFLLNVVQREDLALPDRSGDCNCEVPKCLQLDHRRRRWM